MVKEYRFSVIIPCYNEASKILNAYHILIKKILKDYSNDNVEIIFSNDGSSDNTKDVLNSLHILHNSLIKVNKQGYPSLVTLNNYPNHGKGYAIKEGILTAQGKVVLYCDVDMSTDIKDLSTAISLVEKGNTIALGSRILKDSVLPNKKEKNRNLMSDVCQKLSALIFDWKKMDTQCGFKSIETKFAKKVALNQCINRFAFDLEYLYAAKLNEKTFCDFPVTWTDDKDSRVNPLKDSIRFFRDIVRIKLNKKNLVFTKKGN